MNDESIKKNISTNIGKYREIAGLNQKELAKKLGVVPSRISNWETGQNCPTIDILFEVCEILNVSINDIYGVYPDSNFTLNFDEQLLIRKYRNLDSHGKEMVDFTLLKEWERSMQNKPEINKDILSINKNAPILNAAHARTDIEIPADADIYESEIMDDQNF